MLEKIEQITNGENGKLDKKYSKKEFEKRLGASIDSFWNNNKLWKENEYGTQDLIFNIDDDINFMLEVDSNDCITHITKID